MKKPISAVAIAKRATTVRVANSDKTTARRRSASLVAYIQRSENAEYDLLIKSTKRALRSKVQKINSK